MAKKIDLSKLELGPKKPIKKAEPTNLDEAVKQIHKEEKPPTPSAKTSQKVIEAERTRRVTLDIPVSLHKLIKARVFDRDSTMKKYFLELARMDLKERILQD